MLVDIAFTDAQKLDYPSNLDGKVWVSSWQL